MLEYDRLVYDKGTGKWHVLDAETCEWQEVKVTVEDAWFKDCRDSRIVSDLRKEDPEWFNVIKQAFER